MSTSFTETNSGKRKWLFIGLSILILVMVIMFTWDAEDSADVSLADQSPPPPIVSVIEVNAEDTRATLEAYAELRPRWDAEIRASVPGRIVEVHDSALTGQRVEAGTLLFSIEKTQFEMAVANAELVLEQARLDRWHAQNHVTIARQQFARDGSEPPNELALRLPQLRIAEQAVVSAESQLKAAKRHLYDAEVTAPFSGFVTQRMVSLGQTVVAGEPLIHLSDDRAFEAVAEVNQSDWALLDHPIARKNAQLYVQDGTPVGEATIRQGGGFLDEHTRQRRIFLEVVDPGSDVLAGDFVRVELPGRTLTEALTIPESALSRSGYVWMAGNDDLLIRIEPEVLFRADGDLTIQAPDGTGPWRIAVHPLASFFPGKKVTPLLAEG